MFVMAYLGFEFAVVLAGMDARNVLARCLGVTSSAALAPLDPASLSRPAAGALLIASTSTTHALCG